jgi:hypothetical protein
MLMRVIAAALVLAGGLSIVSAANSADGCGNGCHATVTGACVIDGWTTGAFRNECPVAERAFDFARPARHPLRKHHRRAAGHGEKAAAPAK